MWKLFRFKGFFYKRQKRIQLTHSLCQPNSVTLRYWGSRGKLCPRCRQPVGSRLSQLVPCTGFAILVPVYIEYYIFVLFWRFYVNITSKGLKMEYSTSRFLMMFMDDISIQQHLTQDCAQKQSHASRIVRIDDSRHVRLFPRPRPAMARRSPLAAFHPIWKKALRPDLGELGRQLPLWIYVNLHWHITGMRLLIAIICLEWWQRPVGDFQVVWWTGAYFCHVIMARAHRSHFILLLRCIATSAAPTLDSVETMSLQSGSWMLPLHLPRCFSTEVKHFWAWATPDLNENPVLGYIREHRRLGGFQWDWIYDTLSCDAVPRGESGLMLSLLTFGGTCSGPFFDASCEVGPRPTFRDHTLYFYGAQASTWSKAAEPGLKENERKIADIESAGRVKGVLH